MTMMFYMKPHYRSGGPGTGGDSGGGFKKQIQIYEDWIYDKVQPKRAKVNPANIHPYFADKPQLVPLAQELLQDGFDIEEILLLFMMTER